METNRIVDISTIPKLAKSEGYKFISLISPEGIALVNFNPIKGTITFEQNYKKICDKLKSPVSSPGRYRILMSEKLTKGYHADEFIIIKQGAIDNKNSYPIVFQEPSKTEITQQPESVISFEKALALYTELSDLKAEKRYLLQQIDEQQKEISELNSEIDELEKKTQLQEKPEATVGSFLKENSTIFMPLLENFLKKQNEPSNTKIAEEKTAPAPKKPIEIGSKTHLHLMDMLYTNQRFETLAQQLAKVEETNPELYALLIEKYKISQQ